MKTKSLVMMMAGLFFATQAFAVEVHSLTECTQLATDTEDYVQQELGAKDGPKGACYFVYFSPQLTSVKFDSSTQKCSFALKVDPNDMSAYPCTPGSVVDVLNAPFRDVSLVIAKQNFRRACIKNGTNRVSYDPKNLTTVCETNGL